MIWNKIYLKRCLIASMIAFGASLSHKTFLITASKCELMPGYVPRMAMKMAFSMPLTPKWSSLLDLLPHVLHTLTLSFSSSSVAGIARSSSMGQSLERHFDVFESFFYCIHEAFACSCFRFRFLLPRETQLVDTPITLSLLQTGQRLATASPSASPSPCHRSCSSCLCHCLCCVHMCGP